MRRRVGRRATLGRPLPLARSLPFPSPHTRERTPPSLLRAVRAASSRTVSRVHTHAARPAEPRARALRGARADDGEAATRGMEAKRPRFLTPASRRMLAAAAAASPASRRRARPLVRRLLVPRAPPKRPTPRGLIARLDEPSERASERRHGLSSHQPRRLLFLSLFLCISSTDSLSLSLSVFLCGYSLHMMCRRRRLFARVARCGD